MSRAGRWDVSYEQCTLLMAPSISMVTLRTRLSRFAANCIYETWRNSRLGVSVPTSDCKVVLSLQL